MTAQTEALQVIASVSGVATSELKPETRLVADLGIDSAKTLQLIVKLETELGLEISDEEVAEMQTVGKVLEFIARHRPGA